MVPGHVQALQDMFCAPTVHPTVGLGEKVKLTKTFRPTCFFAPTVHPTATTSPTIGANIFEHLSLGT